MGSTAHQVANARLRSRREALGFIVGSIAAFGVSACTTPSSEDFDVLLDSFYDSGEGRQAMLDAVAETSRPAMTRIGTTSRGTFTSSIDGYLASNPGTVFTWAAGSGLADLIRGGRVEEVSDAWKSSALNPRLRRISSDSSGVQFMVPLWYDPVAFFYSRRAWADAGYSAPSNPDELVDLAQSMADDGVSAFGLARLANPALIALFDYLALSAHGIAAYRKSITEPDFDLEPFSADVIGTIQELVQIESVVDPAAPVSIVPARLSEALARDGDEGDLGSFVLEGRAVVAHCEGLMLAQAGADEDQSKARQLLVDLSQIAPQEAFLGADATMLTGNLNANYQAMSDTMLDMVEIIDNALDIVEPSEAASPAVLTELTTRLNEIVRP